MLAPLLEMLGGVDTIRPLGSRSGRFGRDPCSVSRVASPLNFLASGTDKANPRVSATSSIVRVYKGYTFFMVLYTLRAYQTQR